MDLCSLVFLLAKVIMQPSSIQSRLKLANIADKLCGMEDIVISASFMRITENSSVGALFCCEVQSSIFHAT
jgi:hypothetical protein